MKKKTLRAHPRLGWAIVMSNNVIDAVSLKRKDFSCLLIGERLARVRITEVPKKPRKTA